MKHFKYSFLVTLLGLIGIAVWGFLQGGFSMLLTLVGFTMILSVMEVSLSFDNAVVNASILKTWNRYWQMIFLTVGMFVAVFGMRLLFPIVIVAQTADMGLMEVWQLALNDPDQYSANLQEHHAEISAFGGMFLLLVFLHFLFDHDKELHWLGFIEEKISQLGKIDAISIFVALSILMISATLVDENHKFPVLLAGLWGIVIYLGVKFIGALLEGQHQGVEQATQVVAKGGIGGFIYLELLDASFSFDGVIGAFAITKDIVVIMMGLGIGAMFVRSMTVYLVEKGTLDSYVYLEHGAHYAIGILALIMLLSIEFHIPEVITGLTGVGFILLSLYSSTKYRAKAPS